MLELLQMVGFLALLFAASMAVSYAVTARKRKKLLIVPLPENTRVRMVGPGGSYRAFFLRQTKNGLVFSAPLQRDHFVPVRIGEALMVQAPLDDSIVTFRSTVTHRDPVTHELTLAAPSRIKHSDRRTEDREANLRGAIVKANGETSTLLDLSAGGARIVTTAPIEPGDTVRLELPMDYGTAHGWALESIAIAQGRSQAREVRLRFEEPLSGLVTHRRRQLYLGN